MKIDGILPSNYYSEFLGLKYLLRGLKIHKKIATTSTAWYAKAISRCVHVGCTKLNGITTRPAICDKTSVTVIASSLKQWDKRMPECCMGRVYMLHGKRNWTVKSPKWITKGHFTMILWKGYRSCSLVGKIVYNFSCICWQHSLRGEDNSCCWMIFGPRWAFLLDILGRPHISTWAKIISM